MGAIDKAGGGTLKVTTFELGGMKEIGTTTNQ